MTCAHCSRTVLTVRGGCVSLHAPEPQVWCGRLLSQEAVGSDAVWSSTCLTGRKCGRWRVIVDTSLGFAISDDLHFSILICALSDQTRVSASPSAAVLQLVPDDRAECSVACVPRGAMGGGPGGKGAGAGRRRGRRPAARFRWADYSALAGLTSHAARRGSHADGPATGRTSPWPSDATHAEDRALAL